MRVFHEVRRYDEDFMVWYGGYDNMSFWPHWHEETELIYIRSGAARINVTNNALIVREGDLIICDSGDIHFSDSYQMVNRLEFLVFDPHFLSPRYQYTGLPSPLVSRETLEKAGLDGLVRNLFTQIPRELEKRQPYYQKIVKSLLQEGWYSLLRLLSPDANGPESAQRHYMLGALQQLLTYIDGHIAAPLTLRQAADRMGFSESHFSKFFKQYTGVNFVTYLQMVRVEQAIYQLHDTSKRMVDIAYDCGFNNVRTFNRVFKHFTSYTPGEFCRQKGFDTYTFTFHSRKAALTEQVKNDSIVVMNNSRPLAEMGRERGLLQK